jgi:hypothetical protein
MREKKREIKGSALMLRVGKSRKRRLRFICTATGLLGLVCLLLDTIFFDEV